MIRKEIARGYEQHQQSGQYNQNDPNRSQPTALGLLCYRLTKFLLVLLDFPFVMPDFSLVMTGLTGHLITTIHHRSGISR